MASIAVRLQRKQLGALLGFEHFINFREGAFFNTDTAASAVFFIDIACFFGFFYQKFISTLFAAIFGQQRFGQFIKGCRYSTQPFPLVAVTVGAFSLVMGSYLLISSLSGILH